MNNLRAYDTKIYQSLQEMVREAQTSMGEARMEEVFELVRRFDETLVDETYIILQKDWRQLKKNQLNGTLYENEYRIESRRIAERFLALLSGLEQKFAPTEGGHPIRVNCSEGLDLRQWLDDAQPVKTMEWLRALPAALGSLCTVLVRAPGSADKLMGGVLWEGKTLFVPYDSIGQTASNLEVNILGDDRYLRRVLRAVPGTGRGNRSLGYAVFELEVPANLPSTANTAGRMKSGETGWFFCPARGTSPTADLYLADCLRVQDGWLTFAGENLSPGPGTLVLNRKHQVVGLYLGNRDAEGHYKVLSIYELLEALEGEPTAPSEPVRAMPEPVGAQTLREHHQYSCNRTMQKDDFAITALTHPEEDRQRVHFFLMYGCDLQQHEGLFRWFSARLAGKHNDHLRRSQTEYIRVIAKELSFPANQKIEALKLAMVSDFLSIFNIPPSKIERLREKNLAFALEHSRQLKSLQAGDRIALLFIISEKRWNPRIFQAAIKWFVNDFCRVNLSRHAPQFFFFFGVEYDEDRKDIPEQVREVVEDGEIPINPLAELGMVKEIDVEDWFDTYRRFWRRTRDRKRTFKEYFQKPFAEEGELYMEDVQDFLREIIDKINEPLKDGNRYS